ncbi:MAG TPA: hypothetical protein VLT86_20015 [Vicinamibacterales bacterium]|nr:hypothetical protein [Vicinamibacterales bacterium]
MNDWTPVYLAAMAVSLVIMTSLQLAAVVVAIRLARQTAQALRDFQRDVTPLIEKAHRIADDAARTAALAAAQAERIDEFLRTTTDRVGETLGLVHGAIAGPLRQGSVWLAIVRAAVAIFSGRREGRQPGREDEDALFVG